MEAALELPAPYGFSTNLEGQQKKKAVETMLAERREELAKLVAASDPETD
jgi:hypothetical protein